MKPLILWSLRLQGLRSRAIAGPALDFARADAFAVSQLLPWVDSKQLRAVGSIPAIGGNQEVPRTGGIEWGLYNSRQTGGGSTDKKQGTSCPDCGFYVTWSKVFLAPWSHADNPSASEILFVTVAPVLVIIFVVILWLNYPFIFARFSI